MLRDREKLYQIKSVSGCARTETQVVINWKQRLLTPRVYSLPRTGPATPRTASRRELRPAMALAKVSCQAPRPSVQGAPNPAEQCAKGSASFSGPNLWKGCMRQHPSKHSIHSTLCEQHSHRIQGEGPTVVCRFQFQIGQGSGEKSCPLLPTTLVRTQRVS